MNEQDKIEAIDRIIPVAAHGTKLELEAILSKELGHAFNLGYVDGFCSGLGA